MLTSLTRIFGPPPRWRTDVYICRACGRPETVYSGPDPKADPRRLLDDDGRFRCAACRSGGRDA